MSWFYRNENWRTYLKRYPLTSLFISLNIIVFLLMTIAGGSTNPNTLVQFGAYYKPFVLQGDLYRLFAPIFIHIGWEHLLFNCFAILIFAPGLEVMLGKFRYLILYLGSGLVGFIMTLFFSSAVLAAGASGAIFGVYGMFAYLSMYRRDLMDYYSRQTILPILVIGVVLTFLPGISITGHLGGLATGYLLGFILMRR
ncbi:rhomboid family intramembrane serine protease [Ammoniphilus sp. CFH 90114]|uniref:rhomboid family intramembrane serine protease n=1 Tax=Ammoniphilus sp. CFH 90114 TaxID=2493665 RepID=UPI00100E9B7A|nr:rhomboid family intramembrane serine protease [Ammoniphilus sp. CFH 90114]RXT08129.1 rhomboid family intramembrane serine protease [Ammoniphilus sp. CFH 90114]